MRIGLFITCLTDTFYPRAGIAVVRVLEHLGHQVVFPPNQTCCGQPMFNNGHHDDARDLARRLIDVFDGVETVVTPSGSCAAMIRRHMPGLFEPGTAERSAAEALAARTHEFVELLVRVLQVDLGRLDARWDGEVTWHYSCHLRDLGMTGEVPALLSQIRGLRLLPLEKAEQCCGFGGVFAVAYPQISGGMVAEKVGCIERSGAPTVVSNDAGCTMNLAGGCRRAGSAVRFTSTAEIIAEGLGLLPREGEP
jgi:L-lactate dehydrogenase complex protein LldE